MKTYVAPSTSLLRAHMLFGTNESMGIATASLFVQRCFVGIKERGHPPVEKRARIAPYHHFDYSKRGGCIGDTDQRRRVEYETRVCVQFAVVDDRMFNSDPQDSDGIGQSEERSQERAEASGHRHRSELFPTCVCTVLKNSIVHVQQDDGVIGRS